MRIRGKLNTVVLTVLIATSVAALLLIRATTTVGALGDLARAGNTALRELYRLDSGTKELLITEKALTEERSRWRRWRGRHSRVEAIARADAPVMKVGVDRVVAQLERRGAGGRADAAAPRRRFARRGPVRNRERPARRPPKTGINYGRYAFVIPRRRVLTASTRRLNSSVSSRTCWTKRLSSMLPRAASISSSLR